MTSVVKQYDSRWGYKNYNGSSSIATAACGPFSVDNLFVAKGYDLDPMKVVKFMQKNGYAVYNHGTAWSGIPAALKEFGANDVKNINVDSSMVNVWSKLKNGYSAVFLFSSGSRGGVCWTTSGHYVGVTDYKFKNKQHWLYMRDSGGRDHDGWYCYEKHMKGLIPKVWVSYIPEVKPKKKTKYSGQFPTLPERGYFKRGDDGLQVELLQAFLNWALGYSLREDGDLGEKTEGAISDFEREVGIFPDGNFGKKCLKAAKKFKK